MNKLLPAALLAVFTSVVALHAQTQPSPQAEGERGQRPPPPPIIQALDTNHDGELSAAEIAAAPTALLTLDRNGDGALSRDEIRPPRPEGAPERKGDRPQRPNR